MRLARSVRIALALWLGGAAWSAAIPAGAIVQVPFVGRFTSHRGQLGNLPLVGIDPADFASHLPCSALTIMSGPGGAMVPAPVTPPARTMTGPAARFECALAFGDVGTSALAPGASLELPANALQSFLPGMIDAVSLPPPLVQIATSFRIEGPSAARRFKPGAWMTQAGRAGSMFTWCPGNPACTNVLQGTRPSLPFIVKYAGGGPAFGGTMAALINAGPSPSSLAIRAGGGALAIAKLPAMATLATGRGYADYLNRSLPVGLWAMYKLMTVTRPVVGKQKLVTMVSSYLGAGPKLQSIQYGFPFTTRTVLVRRTGTANGNPAISTISARGADQPGGRYRRNLTLVAGAVTAPFPGSARPVIAQLALPEPSAHGHFVAAAIALGVIAAFRSRTRS